MLLTCVSIYYVVFGIFDGLRHTMYCFVYLDDFNMFVPEINF